MSDNPTSKNSPPGAADAPNKPSADWVAIGEIVGTFGVRGELKVVPLTDFPDRFEQTPTVYVGDAHTPFAIRSARIHKAQVLLTLAGVENPESAERLRGSRLWIPATELRPLAEDQYYLHDVVGLRVRHVNGANLGTISDVMPSAGGDLYVVRNDTTGAEVLLPAVKAFIKQVDIAGGIVIVDPIPGIFDDQFEES